MISEAFQKQIFYSEMAKLLEAGFGIRNAAEVMTGTGLPPAQAHLLEELHRGLDEGKSITESLGGEKGSLSGLELSIIGAGERGGRLPPAMRHLADYYGMLASTRREMLRSMIHPVIVLHLGIFIGSVPTEMIGGTSSGAAIAGGFAASLLTAYALAFAAFIGIRALLRAARENKGTDRMIAGIPLLGKARNQMAMAGFCKVYHTCLLAGIPMRETVRMAVDASQSGMIRDAGKRLENTVAEGNPIGPQMMNEPAFPKTFARSYATGEAAGTLDKDLENWSRFFQSESESGAKALATVLPRVLYFMILVYVGWKIVSFYGSYYDGILNQLE